MLVASIVWKRAHYDYNSHTVGVYGNHIEAVQNLARELCQRGHILNESSLRHKYIQSLRQGKHDTNEKKWKEEERQTMLKSIQSEEALTTVCYKFGDSYYKEVWDWKLELVSLTGKTPREIQLEIALKTLKQESIEQVQTTEEELVTLKGKTPREIELEAQIRILKQELMKQVEITEQILRTISAAVAKSSQS